MSYTWDDELEDLEPKAQHHDWGYRFKQQHESENLFLVVTICTADSTIISQETTCLE